MVCPDVKATAADITQRIYGRDSQRGEQTWRPEGFNEYCSPEIVPLRSCYEGYSLGADRVARLGRPMPCGKKRLNAPQGQPG